MLPLRNPFGRQLLTLPEAAYAAHVSKSSIKYWMQIGYLHSYGGPHSIRINWDELMDFLANPPRKKKPGLPRGVSGRPSKPKVGREDRMALRRLDAAIAALQAEVRMKESKASARPDSA